MVSTQVTYFQNIGTFYIYLKVVSLFLNNVMTRYGAYMMKAFPLCMRQYPMLFQSTRIPKLGQDENRLDQPWF